MFKVLKNNDGFSGLIGILIAIVVIGVMAAMYLPTQTAKNEYYQAHYIAGVTKTIENAENAYMAKNGSFADLVTLSQNGYLSPQFLQSLQPANNPGGPYPQPNWITLELANQTVNLCIDNNGGCPDNPSGNNYFIGLYSIPVNYANYIEHELPGSGIGSQGGGLEYVAYSAPVPSAPATMNTNYVYYTQYQYASAQIALTASNCSSGQYQYINVSTKFVDILIDDNYGYLGGIMVLQPGQETGCASGWELASAYLAK